MKSTNKDMADSLFFWGVPKIYSLGIAVQAVNWNGVSEKKKEAIQKKVSRLAKKIERRQGKVRLGLKTRGFFEIMRMVQKKVGWCQPDVAYWNAQGWTGKKRPWK